MTSTGKINEWWNMLELDDMHVPCRIQEIDNRTFGTDPSSPKTQKGPSRTPIEMASKLCGFTRADPFWVSSPTRRSRHCLLFASSLLAKRGNFPIRAIRPSIASLLVCKLQDVEFLLAGDPILEILEIASCTLDVFQLVSDGKNFAKPIPKRKVKHDKD